MRETAQPRMLTIHFFTENVCPPLFKDSEQAFPSWVIIYRGTWRAHTPSQKYLLHAWMLAVPSTRHHTIGLSINSPCTPLSNRTYLWERLYISTPENFVRMNLLGSVSSLRVKIRTSRDSASWENEENWENGIKCVREGKPTLPSILG